MAYVENLKKKYGNRFTDIENVLGNLRNKVSLSIKKCNRKTSRVLFQELVDEKKVQLNLKSANCIASDTEANSKVKPQIKKKNSNRIQSKSKRKSGISNGNVDPEDGVMYDKWKKENTETRIPAISVQRLLLMLEELDNEDNLSKEQRQLEKCISFQNKSFDTFWDAIQPILKGLRDSLLTRNWDNMTCLLLLLVNKHRAALYMPIIKTLCEVMLEYNPLVKQLNLETQFRGVLISSSEIYKSLN